MILSRSKFGFNLDAIVAAHFSFTNTKHLCFWCNEPYTSVLPSYHKDVVTRPFPPGPNGAVSHFWSKAFLAMARAWAKAYRYEGLAHVLENMCLVCKVCDKIWQVGGVALVEARNCSPMGVKGDDGEAQDLRRQAKRIGGRRCGSLLKWQTP